MKLTPVVAAVDFSPTTDAVLRRARAFVAEGGTIQLVHVIDTSLLPYRIYTDRDIFDRYFTTREEEARERLQALARSRPLAGAKVDTILARGRPADEIVSAASRSGLVIVGAHGQRALGRFLLGSVAEEVARRSPVPALVVREGAEGRAVERVLLALDVAEPSREAIEAASDLAKRRGARLEVIHVVPWRREAHGKSPVAQALRGSLLRESKQAVRSLVSRAIGETVPIRVSLGTPAEKIVAYAKPDDVVVCATHGRGALGRLAFGSVATEVSRRAPCPVLLVKPRPRAPLERTVAAAAAQGAGKA